MRNLKLIWFYALKDLKIFAADRLALFFALLFPFFFAAMFYFLLSGAGSSDERMELHLVTRETDGISNQIISALVTKDAAQLSAGEPLIVQDTDYAADLLAVQNKELSGFIAFPADFSMGIYMGYGANIEVIVDAGATNTRAALYSLAENITSQINAQQVVTDAALGIVIGNNIAAGNPENIGAAIQQILPQLIGGQTNTESTSMTAPIIYNAQNIGEVKAENPSNYVIPGYLVMFVFFTAAMAAEMIIRERKNQTLERLLAGTVSKEVILGGIFTGTAAKGLIQIIIFWTVGILIFKLDMGPSPGGVILLSVLMVIMSASFAIMLGTLSRTQRAAGAIGTLTSLILAPLGGCWWPLFIVPQWMQFIAKFTPHGWANLGFNKLMVLGASFGDVMPNILALIGFTLVFGIIAVWRFRTDAA